MKFSSLITAALAAIPLTAAEVYLKEQFNDEAWKDRWTVSTEWKSADQMGEWAQSAGKFYADASDKGLQTTNDSKFFAISTPLAKTFTSDGKKDLVIQYSVKHEQSIDCGGAYIKLLPGGDKFDAKSFGGETPYRVMFGPDICGATRRTHTILHSKTKNENLLINKDISCEKDVFSHLYTLVIRPDNTFEVFVDNKSVRSGNLKDEFSFLEPKEIKDPNASKPADWVDAAKIPDPNDIKPEGYDDIPPEIPDPDAKKPDDWDDEDDGEWEAPMIDNPDYKGPWTPKMIDNPDYKGPWIHPMIPNPDFKDDDTVSQVCYDGCTHVGFELWQVKSGTIFDDIFIGDSLSEAQAFAEETFFKKRDGEKAMYDEQNKVEDPEDGLDDVDFDTDGFEDEF
jgi:calreticulin